MNLIVDPNPNSDGYVLNTTLAKRLADRLGGETHIIHLYDSDQRYFSYEYNEGWIDLVLSAKRLIFPTPMWNLTIPASLKDFFDKTTRRGRLWDLDGQKNYIGLLNEKSAFIIMTSGEWYPPGSPNDFVVPYLRAILSFLGIREIKDFRVGGLKDKSLTNGQSYLNEKTEEMLVSFGVKSHKL